MEVSPKCHLKHIMGAVRLVGLVANRPEISDWAKVVMKIREWEDQT